MHCRLSSLLDKNSWNQLPNGFLVLRAYGDSNEGDPGAAFPTLYMQGGMRQRLVPLHLHQLLIMVLVDTAHSLTAANVAALHAVAEPAAKMLATRLIDYGGADAGHIPGYRYMILDGSRCSMEASPRSKISAMTHQGRALVSSLRESVPLLVAGRSEGDENSHALGSSHWDGCGPSYTAKDGEVHEVLVGSGQDCWMAAECDGSSQAVFLREKRGEKTMMDAAAAFAVFHQIRAQI
jgi:hypothetical protein